MVEILAITGSASLVSVWLYNRSENRKQLSQTRSTASSWWQAPWKRLRLSMQQSKTTVTPSNAPTPTLAPRSTPALVLDPPSALPKSIADDPTVIDYELHSSTLAIIVTTAGRIFAPSLQVAGLPLLIYMGIPSAQKAYDELWIEGRPGRALSETVVLAVCLASGHYWVGSLGFWCYYGGRRLLAEKPQINVIQQSEWSVPETTHLWKDGVANSVSTATLQPGDHLLLHSGEMLPTDGIITEGVAWLRPQTMTPIAHGFRKGVGDRVAATDIVLVGRICVKVI